MKNHYIHCIFILAFFISGLNSFAQDTDWSVEVSNMIVNTKTPATVGKWQYEDGLLLEGILRVYKRTGNSQYLKFISDWAQLHIASDGTIDQPLNSLDNIMSGFMVLHLYKETGITQFKLAADKLRQRFDTYPRTSDSCFWHATDLENELWLDGLYMGMPFLATYGEYFNDQNYAYKEVIRQFVRHINHLRDDQTNLLLHAYDEDGSEPWALPPLNRSPWAWGRAIGWVAMGLSEVLDIIPTTFPQRDQMVTQYISLLKALANFQDTTTGLWFQVVDHGSDPNNWRETSCSMMFTYAMKRAIQLGFLDQTFTKYVNRGYAGILTKISKAGTNQINLIDISEGTSVSADINYYYSRARNTNDYHGLGTFLIMNEFVAYNNLPFRPGNESPVHYITATTGGNGTITPSGSVQVPDGGNQVFTISPNEYYQIQSLLVDNSPVSIVNSYSFNNVISDHSISATFSLIPTLTVSPSNQNVTSSAGTTTYTITSNIPWTASSNQTWCTVTPSGTGNGTITATCPANAGISVRTATITVTGSGVSNQTVTVTQAAAPAILSVSTNTLEVAATANSTASFEITSNISWNVSSNQTWITVNSASGVNNATITVTASANPNVSPRIASVTVSGSGVTSKTITITQDAAPAILSVSTNTLEVAASANSTTSFEITSNISWNVSSNQTWITLSSASGANNATITVTTSANPDPSPRTASVTVSGSGVTSKTITVTQAAAPAILSVSTNTLEVAASANSTATFEITSNISWNVSSYQTWITLSSASGSNNTTITITSSANPNPSPRTASVTVLGSGVTSKTITVTQAAAPAFLSVSTNTLEVAASTNSTATFEITSNISWNVSINQTWITLSSASGSNNATIMVTASANPDASPRTASVTVSGSGVASKTITVTQDAAPAILSVSTNTLEVAASANSMASFKITSNINWNVSTNQTWITVSSASGSNNATITVTASANPNPSPRTASVTVSGSGVASKTITVTQDAAPAILSVSTNTLEVAASANSTTTFEITSNISWNVSSNQTWITLSSASGSNNTTITITSSANPDLSPRAASVTVSGSGVTSKTITVTQAAAPAILSVSTNTLEVAASANSTTSFEITSNISWNVSSNQTWITLSSASGVNNTTITITSSANPDPSPRAASVTVSGSGVTSKTITVTQAAAPAILSVSTNTLEVAASANSTASFEITSNISWNVSSNQTWITLSSASGSNNATITVTASANPDPSPRAANITISGDDVSSDTIGVTQAAGSATSVNEISNTDITFYPIPVTDKLMVSSSKPFSKTSIVIYNLNGKEVYSSIISNSITEIDMSKYASGVYMVKLITPDKGILARKIIKQ